MNAADQIGSVFVVLWGTFMLWLVNRGIRSQESLISLFTTWPTRRPKEFITWLGISAVVFALLCLLLFSEDDATRLAQHHLQAPGTFIEYPGSHANFRYKFTVNGSQYFGYSSSDQVELGNIQRGDPFPVYYNPVNPNINNASEPIRSLVNGQIMGTFFSILFVCVLAICIRKIGCIVRESATRFPQDAVLKE